MMKKFRPFAVLAFIALLFGAIAMLAQYPGQPTGGNSVGVYMDVMSSLKPPGVLHTNNQEYVSVAASATNTLLDVAGPGYVSEMLLSLNSTDVVARRDSVLKVYYNSEAGATISGTVEQLTASTYFTADATPIRYQNRFFTVEANTTGTARAAYVWRLPIPFTSHIKITLTNASATTAINPFIAQVAYRTSVPNTWPNTRRLRVASYASGAGGCAPNALVTIMDQSTIGVPGRLAGLYWLGDAYPNSVTPRNGPQEGDFHIYLDGSGTASYESTGTEDIFFSPHNGTGQGMLADVLVGDGSRNGSAYPGYDVGTIFTDDVPAYVTASWYRFFVDDPITFNTGLKITWDCGNTAQLSFVNNPVVYATVWYYTQN